MRVGTLSSASIPANNFVPVGLPPASCLLFYFIYLCIYLFIVYVFILCGGLVLLCFFRFSFRLCVCVCACGLMHMWVLVLQSPERHWSGVTGSRALPDVGAGNQVQSSSPWAIFAAPVLVFKIAFNPMSPIQLFFILVHFHSKFFFSIYIFTCNIYC